MSQNDRTPHEQALTSQREGRSLSTRDWNEQDAERILSLTDEQAATELEATAVTGCAAARYAGETVLNERERNLLGW